MICVHILTYCRNIELLYGTELIFNTLRVGFPNACVKILDNASVPEAAARIAALCKQNDCLFERVGGAGIAHSDFIENTIRAHAAGPDANGPLVFLDPDICLWESCEGFSFKGLYAGKLVARFNDSISKTITMPRLHTSFLWIHHAGALRREILKLKAAHFDFRPFQPFSFKMDGSWYRYDTGAALYAAVAERCSCFNDEHLNCYDHIYAGSHIDWLFHGYDEECRKMMNRIHELAKKPDLQALKGIWKVQDEVFLRSFNNN